MMKRTLLKKCIRDARLLWIATALVLFAFSWMRMYIVSRLELDAFARIVGELWDKWSAFSPVSLQQLISYSGRIALTFDEPIIVFGIAVFAITRGSDCVSGELNRGTMEMLLAQPLSRLSVISAQGMVTCYGIALLALSVWAGVTAGIYSFQVKEEVAKEIRVPVINLRIPVPFAKKEIIRVPMHTKVNANNFLPPTATLFSFGICIAGVTTLLSACDRYRWRTIGIASGLFVMQIILRLSALAFPEEKWLGYANIFSLYNPQAIVEHAVRRPESVWHLAVFSADGKFASLAPLGSDLVLLGIGVIAYIAAAIVFQKRDLPAPL